MASLVTARVSAKDVESRAERAQQRRRDEALRRQREARRNLTDHARRLGAHVEAEAEAAAEGEATQVVTTAADRRRQKSAKALRKRAELWSKEFMVPEWMVDIPEGLDGKGDKLGGGWYVFARPEGKRCLIVATKKSKCTSRALHGETVHRDFAAGLPLGSVLDAVFVEPKTYFVVDCMAWGKQALYDCTAEFRLFWLRTKLGELAGGEGPFTLAPVPYFEADVAGIRQAYEVPLPYLRDGLVFYAKQGHYALGLTPLAALWKDPRSTRYFAPADDRHFAILRAGDDDDDDGGGGGGGSNPRTLDSVTVPCVGDRSPTVPGGDLARYEVSLVAAPDGPAHGGDLAVVARYERRCSPKRAVADSWSKIFFALRHRTNPLTLDTILAAAAASAISQQRAAAQATLLQQQQPPQGGSGGQT